MFSPPQIQTKAGNLKHNTSPEMWCWSVANTTWIDHIWLPWLLSRRGVPRLIVGERDQTWLTKNPRVRKYDLWRSFLLCGSQPQSLPHSLNDILMICTAQSDPLNFQPTLNNRGITDAGSEKGIKSSSHISRIIWKKGNAKS